MALIVQKYGGSSVANFDLIRNVAERVIKTKKEGNQVVVVLSAMKGETDRLLAMASKISKMPNERELDVLISTGEMVSVSLFAMACQEMGEVCKSFSGRQAGIETDNFYQKARIKEVKPERIISELAKDRIVVVAGFQGINKRNDITTLGRGGSDTTAVALAAALKADVCEIYTDVDGIYTTDPNICEKARKLDRISYEEMLELSSLGTKIMEIRSVELGTINGVKIHVRHARKDIMGTFICEEDKDMERKPVTGIAYSKNEARVTLTEVANKPGIASKILNIVSSSGIIVDMIIQNQGQLLANGDSFVADFSFTVSKNDYQKTIGLMEAIKKDLNIKTVCGDDNIAKVSLVGVGMRNHAGIAAKMFQVLANEGINISMISTSEIKISCIIEKKYAELAVRALHDAFELEEEIKYQPSFR